MPLMLRLRAIAYTLLLACGGCCGVGERSTSNLLESLSRQVPIGTPESAVVSTLQQNNFRAIDLPYEYRVIGWSTEGAGTCFFTYRIFRVDVGIDHSGKVYAVIVRAYTKHLWI
jgi:hypothetical protein